MPLGRFIAVSGLLDDDSNVSTTSPSGIISGLGEYWSKISAGCDIDQDHAQQLLQNIRPWNWSAYKTPSAELLGRQLKLARDSGVGRDGLPYSAWRASDYSVSLLEDAHDCAHVHWLE